MGLLENTGVGDWLAGAAAFNGNGGSGPGLGGLSLGDLTPSPTSTTGSSETPDRPAGESWNTQHVPWRLPGIPATSPVQTQYVTQSWAESQYNSAAFKPIRADLEKLAKILGYRTGKSLWNAAVEAANEQYNQNINTYGTGYAVTPFDIISEWAGGGSGSSGSGSSGSGSGSSGSGSSGSAYMGPVTSTASQTDTSVTQPGDAENLLYGAMQELLGRAPTEKEISRFTSRLNAAERAAPVVSTQTTTSAPGDDGPDGGYTNQTSETTGGVNQQVQARDYAQSRPDYAEYQMATTYFDAFQSLIRGA